MTARDIVARTLFPLALVVPACLCGEPPPEVPDGPAASVATIFVQVQGVVRDALTGLPLEGADVDIPAAGEAKRHQVTDENGFYSVRFEGFGAFLVFISADSYVSTRRTVLATLADAPEASFVIHVVNDMNMFPLLGSVSGIVAGTGRIDAVSGARVIIRLDPNLLGALDTSGVALEVTTGADGSYAFTGLPAGVALRLLIPAQDLDADGLPDFATSVTQIGALDEAPIVQNIVVAPFTIDEVVWSSFDNVESFAVQPDVTFELVYAGTMSTTPGGTTVDLLRSGVRVATEFQWDADGLVLTITPRAPLSVGQQYSIEVTATTRNNDLVQWGPYSFMVGGDRVPGAVTNLALVGAPEDLSFVQPSFTVGFDAVLDATGYRVYARNDAQQSDWLQVASAVATSLDPVAPQISFILPTAFDSVPGTRTPFGFSETVQIAVAALIGQNEGPFPATAISVTDVACPTFLVTRGGNFNNASGASDVLVYLDVTAVVGEWIDPTTAPTVSFTDYAFPGGDGFLFAPTAFTLEVLDRGTMRLSAMLPAGESAMLDRYVVDVSALADPSGNLACVSGYPPPGLPGAGLSQSGGWDMEATLGWSGQAPWERGAPADGPGAANDGTNVWGTNLTGNYSDVAAATAVLSSADVVLPVMSAAASYRRWNALGTGDTVAVYWVQNGGTAQFLEQYSGTNGFWQAEALSIAAYSGQTGHFEFRLGVDGLATAAAGFYLDTFVIQGFWVLP